MASRSRLSRSARIRPAPSVRRRWSVPSMGRHPAGGSPARDRLATPVRGETGSPRGTDPGRDAPRLAAADEVARQDRPPGDDLTGLGEADRRRPPRAPGGLRRGGSAEAAAAREVVLDEGRPARLDASGEPILERAADQPAPPGVAEQPADRLDLQAEPPG